MPPGRSTPPRSTPTRTGGTRRALTAIALGLGALAWLELGAGREIEPPTALAPAAARPAADSLAEVSEDRPAASPATDPQRDAPNEDTSIPFHGFCPGDEELPAVRRPRLWDRLELRAHEVQDRARAAQRAGASQALRAGLKALARDDAETALRQLTAAPDREQGGYDHVLGALLLSGARAHGRGDHRRALSLGERAVSLAPEDADAHALVALAAGVLGKAARQRRALRAAHATEEDEPAFGLALGRALANTEHVAEAVRALDVYLGGHREDVGIAQLRARLDTQRQIEHGFRRTAGGSVTLLWPADVLERGDALSLHRLLSDSLDEAAVLTGMERRDELHAVVYRDRSELLATTCVPSWTAGVFDGTLRLQTTALEDPERRRATVRHEVLHAQLHSGRFVAPHWFHEGLAQHFAGEAGPGHERSYRMMVDARTYIPLASLEGSFLVIDRGHDARLAYHQSLALVELLFDRAGRNAAARAVAFLQDGGDAESLLAHVAGADVDGRDLLGFLERRLDSP